MKHAQSHLKRSLLLLAMLLPVGPATALEEGQAPEARAASLRAQARELEAQIEAECLKVAPPARAQCRRHLGQAVARLRGTAGRANEAGLSALQPPW